MTQDVLVTDGTGGALGTWINMTRTITWQKYPASDLGWVGLRVVGTGWAEWPSSMKQRKEAYNLISGLDSTPWVY